MTDWARSVLDRTVPGWRVASIEPVGRGNYKRTAVVTLDGAADDGDPPASPTGNGDSGVPPSVVVQWSDRPAALRTELALLAAVGRRTDLPVPTVLATDVNRREDEAGAVLERSPGRDLHEAFVSLDPSSQAAVARTFGRALATLHDAFRFDAYGPVRYTRTRIIRQTDGCVGSETGPPRRTDDERVDRFVSGCRAGDGGFVATGPADWPTWFGTYAREGARALPDPLAGYRDRVVAAVDAASLPARPPSRLYPWDLRPGNALVADGAVTALLDWGDPLAAAPGLALAKTEHLVADWYVEDPQPLRAAFREGYRAVGPLPDVPRVYRLVAVIRSAVDSRGAVTRPGYPERTGEAAVAFHRDRIETLLI